MIKNDLILRAAKGEETERVPVWLMRQAGRILPEYRAVRGRLSGFKELAETPELAAEVTLQPVDILGVDAAIIFSDILVVPEAMGLPYEMIEAKGPWFPHNLQNAENLKKVHVPDVEDTLGYVLEAIKITKKELDNRVPLIGFAGAPFTILAYMVEGSGSKTFSNTKKFMYTQPEKAKEILDKITTTTITYLKAQIAAGANMVQLFDSWAGILGPESYREFAMPYLTRIAAEITEVPVTLFSKGAYFAIEDLAATSCNTIGVDWSMDPKWVRSITSGKTLQGNLDPCVLYGDFKFIEQQTKSMIDTFGKQHYIANLGHGVYPDTPVDAVKCFIETIKSY